LEGISLSAKNTANFQDRYLSQLRKKAVPTTVYLTNGFQLKGVITALDNYTVLMEVDEKQMLIFKHAISTIAPMNSVDIKNEAPEDENDV